MLRFASSPTSDMHIGNLRVALLNYIVSQQKKEDFIVRIEDMDKEKNIEGKDDETLDLLALFGVKYTQVIHQSENVKFHTAMALQLIHDKKAFSCFCSPDWLQKKRDEAKARKKTYSYDDACRNLPAELVIDNLSPFTIRIARPEFNTTIKDKIKGNVDFEPDAVDSFIIMKEDKAPTHNFASAVDDMLSDISLVVCDSEHIDDAPKQEHIRESLKYDKIVEYAHIPIMLNDNDEKISAKDNNASIKWLLEEGYIPNAISNYLVLIGNKPPQEIFKFTDAVEWLKLENISPSPTRFDINLLKLHPSE